MSKQNWMAMGPKRNSSHPLPSLLGHMWLQVCWLGGCILTARAHQQAWFYDFSWLVAACGCIWLSVTVCGLLSVPCFPNPGPYFQQSVVQAPTKNTRINENWKQGHRHTTTFGCQVFCIPKQKEARFCRKWPLFFGPRALRARLLLLKKVHFSKTQNCFTKSRLSFFKGVHFPIKFPESALLGNGRFPG